mmetsp:Transcript_53361/g.165736  ORF Transcript_53361/g.165736 Transcript_53361/m.165736 type:complete len:168 (+) Transcript_53361:1-504(+)
MAPIKAGIIEQAVGPQPGAPAEYGAAGQPFLVSNFAGGLSLASPHQIKFHTCCRDGDHKAVQEWLNADTRDEIDVDWRDSVGMTALMWAALDGNMEAARALLEAGADAAITDGANPDEPVTALDYALGIGIPADSEDETDDEDEGRGPHPEVAELIRSFTARSGQCA